MRNFRRIVAAVLMLMLFAGIVPVSPLTAKASQNTTVLIAASDFQSYVDTHYTCRDQMNEIFRQIRKDYSHADGFLFMGDYYHDYSNYQSEFGIQMMTQTVLNAGFGIEEEAIIKVQGNHDYVGTRYLSPSGNNDPDSGEYGVFVINEDDYMWFAGTQSQNGSENVAQHAARVQQTAENLAEYLEEKIEENYTAPIFVLSHLPLHYSMRTFVHGDGRYARYIYDELEYGANNGLNIVFLFGHNHSHGWDHHLGGSSIYLTRGDTINIGVPSDTKACVEETLGFTYLNAGYIGYFSTDYNEAVDTALTMTVYEITDGELIIKRYDKNGLHNLKSAGGMNLVPYNGRLEVQHGIFSIDYKVYPPTQKLELFTDGQDYTPSTCKTAGTNGYVVSASGKIYTDATLRKPTTKAAQALPLSGHRYSYTSQGTQTHEASCVYCNASFEENHHYYSLSCEDCAQKRSLTCVPAKESTCSQKGNILYYWHPESKTYYTDSRGYKPTTLNEVTLPLLPHNFDAGYEKNEAGHRPLCSCGEKDTQASHSFSDGVCTVCSFEKSVLLTYIPKKDSTCKVQGNNAYYYDPETGLCYKDAKGTVSTNAAKELLPLASHSYQSDHLCKVCRAKDPNAPAQTSSSAPASSSAPSSSVVPSSSAVMSSSVIASSSAPGSTSAVPSNSAVAATTPASSQTTAQGNDMTAIYVASSIAAVGALIAGVGIYLKKKRRW